MARPHQQHHTVSAGYLRLFATASRGKDRVHVLDLITGRWRRQQPIDICKRRDFYAIDAEGLGQNVVETSILGRLEGDTVPLLRRLNQEARDFPKSGRLPQLRNRDEFELLAGFTAMAYLRTDLARTSLDRGSEIFIREMSKRMNPDRETFERRRQEAQREGVNVGDLTYEEFTRVIEGDDFRIGTDQTFKVALMVLSWKGLYQRFRERTCSLLIADGAAGFFVTSNAPVGICASGNSGELIPYKTDPRETRFTILMSLSPRVLLRLDNREAPEVRQSTEREVAMSNSAVTLPQRSLVFAIDKNFNWLNGDRIDDSTRLPAVAQKTTQQTDDYESDTHRTMVRERLDELFREQET